MRENAPESGIMLAHDPGGDSNRHCLHQHHRQGFKQEREATARTCPGYLDGQDATVITSDPWHPGMKEGLILKEVQMAPGPALGIVSLTFGPAALRATENAAPAKINLNIKALLSEVKPARLDLPGRNKSQRNMK